MFSTVCSEHHSTLDFTKLEASLTNHFDLTTGSGLELELLFLTANSCINSVCNAMFINWTEKDVYKVFTSKILTPLKLLTGWMMVFQNVPEQVEEKAMKN